MTKITHQNLEIVEKLMELMGKNSIDSLEIDGIKMTKTNLQVDQPPVNEGRDQTDEELLFYSAE